MKLAASFADGPSLPRREGGISASTVTTFTVPEALADRLPAFDNDDLEALEQVGEPSREMIVEELISSVEAWLVSPRADEDTARNIRCLIEAAKLIEKGQHEKAISFPQIRAGVPEPYLSGVRRPA